MFFSCFAVYVLANSTRVVRYFYRRVWPPYSISFVSYCFEQHFKWLYLWNRKSDFVLLDRITNYNYCDVYTMEGTRARVCLTKILTAMSECRVM